MQNKTAGKMHNANSQWHCIQMEHSSRVAHHSLYAYASTKNINGSMVYYIKINKGFERSLKMYI